MLLQAAADEDNDTFEVAELNNDDEDDNACKAHVLTYRHSQGWVLLNCRCKACYMSA
jgi:hypothetical protein